VTMDDLRRNGFSESILRSLAAVTKTAAEHAAKDDDSYFRFVARTAADRIGRHVRRADLEHNLDESRIATPTEKDRERLARYREAIARLDAVPSGDRRRRSGCALGTGGASGSRCRAPRLR
jgi:hypothetical protein